MDSTFARTWIVRAATCLLMLTGLGCGLGKKQMVSELRLHQSNWDTLSVSIQFKERTLLGKEGSTQPDAVMIYLFNAAYDTLHIDTTLTIAVDDFGLGNEEEVLVEACGAFGRVMVCDQDVFTASPKRFLTTSLVDYPVEGNFDRGRFEVRYALERRAFRDGQWEATPKKQPIKGYVRVYVEDKPEEAIQLPLRRNAERFDLSRHENHSDFNYLLRSSLYDKKEAVVRFDFYASMANQPEHLIASLEKRIRKKSKEDQQREVHAFVAQIAEHVQDRLKAPWQGVRSYVQEWSFDEKKGTYAIAVEMAWRRGTSFFDRSDELLGKLEVAEDGQGGTFVLIQASRPVDRMWRERVGKDTLDLPTLIPPDPSLPEDLFMHPDSTQAEEEIDRW